MPARGRRPRPTKPKPPTRPTRIRDRVKPPPTPTVTQPAVPTPVSQERPPQWAPYAPAAVGERERSRLLGPRGQVVRPQWAPYATQVRGATGEALRTLPVTAGARLTPAEFTEKYGRYDPARPQPFDPGDPRNLRYERALAVANQLAGGQRPNIRRLWAEQLGLSQEDLEAYGYETEGPMYGIFRYKAPTVVTDGGGGGGGGGYVSRGGGYRRPSTAGGGRGVVGRTGLVMWRIGL